MTTPLQSSAKIPFTKASACGNDFLLVELAYASGNLTALTRQLCDRHNGVGADGVEWLSPDAEADVKASLINADGSPATAPVVWQRRFARGKGRPKFS